MKICGEYFIIAAEANGAKGMPRPGVSKVSPPLAM